MGKAPASDYTPIQDKVVLNLLPFQKTITGSIKQMSMCFHVETGQMFVVTWKLVVCSSCSPVNMILPLLLKGHRLCINLIIQDLAQNLPGQVLA